MKTMGDVMRAIPGALARALVVLPAMVIALSLGVSAPARAVTPTATLYSAGWYGGTPLQLTGSFSDLPAYGFNDVASSIRVPAGVVVSVFEHVNWFGRCETFRADDDNLTNNAIGNDTISSVRVGVPCPVLLWDGANYSGSITTASGDIPDLGLRFSNTISSLKVNGRRVALYDLPNYGGLCEEFTADDPDSSNNPILERTSSLRLDVGCTKQAVLFADINYGGEYTMIPLDYSWRPLEAAWKDRASSIHVTSGVVLDASNYWVSSNTFRGSTTVLQACQRFTADYPDLRTSLVFNDGIDQVAALDRYPFIWESTQCILNSL
jgi:hypothetical protein